jgi:hypothetical protein
VPKIKARMSGSRGKAQKKTLYISLSKIWSNGRGDAIDMDGRSGGLYVYSLIRQKVALLRDYSFATRRTLD